MNEFFISIFFLFIVFIGAAAFSAKTKKANFSSYFLNLEMEYIVIGILVYLINLKFFNTTLQNTTTTFIGITLSFMGMLIGTQFKYKILKKIPGSFWKYICYTYISGFVLIYLVFYLMGYETPYLYAIIINTGMPYSLNLFARLFRIGISKYFNSMLVLSIYPAITLAHYTVYFYISNGDTPYRFLSLLWLIVFLFIIKEYGKQQSRKMFNTMCVILMYTISGLSIYLRVSPIALGFISGIIASNFTFGDIFTNFYKSFERFFYLFIYMILGFFVVMHGTFLPKDILTAFLITGILFIMRNIAFQRQFKKMESNRVEVQAITTIGVLPGFLIFDHLFITFSPSSLAIVSIFLLIYILTEILNYRTLINETEKH